MIFVHDIEACLQLLPPRAMEIVKRFALQEYTQREAAVLLGMQQKSLGRYYDQALDSLSAILIQRRLLGLGS